jgi:H+/gluconate symporter-like permease
VKGKKEEKKINNEQSKNFWFGFFPLLVPFIPLLLRTPTCMKIHKIILPMPKED